VSIARPSRPSPAGAGPAAPRVTVRLLGHFELRIDGDEVDLPTGPQRLAAYLALRGVTPRCRVAGELWPETAQRRAMGCLRTAMWRANQAARGLVCAVGSALDLDRGADVDVRRTLTTSHAPDASADVLRTPPPAVDLLPTWEDDWLVHDRERLRQLQLHRLEAGADHLRATREFGLALEWALAALRADPLRETAHRSVISIHLAEGNLVEARRMYDACVELFRRELGVRPSTMTSDLMLGALTPSS